MDRWVRSRLHSTVRDVTTALDGFDALELMPRARHIAAALRRFLPDDYARAANILIDSLGPKLERDAGNGMAPFFYLPHVFYVAEHGLDHFELSMRAQYELTQRFTAEFSIRPYLIHHQQRTLKTLAAWSDDASVHVRRLVSEGTRPRLPWAVRLPAFQRDPRPVLKLLERLNHRWTQTRKPLPMTLHQQLQQTPASTLAGHNHNHTR